MGTPKGTKPWNAGNSKGWIDPRGYRIISRTINGKRQQIREHRLIMENHLNRKLEPWEVVHHKDGNILNNEISNLEVMTFGEHTAQHHKNSRHAYDSKRTMEVFGNMRQALIRERESNADLLAALEAMVGDGKHSERESLKMARDAIAKAKGDNQ